MVMDGGGWEQYDGEDVQFDETVGSVLLATSSEQLASCREDCLRLGYGGFVVRGDKATFRPYSREEILKSKTTRLWGQTTLHVAPAPPQPSASASLTVSHGNISVSVVTEEPLCRRSGYFASLFRSAWADGAEHHEFQEFPGGTEAFRFAVSWLSTESGQPVGVPWPVRDSRQLCGIISAAVYLDSASLLCAATQSWHVATKRPSDQLLCVAESLAEASLQFSLADEEQVVGELQSILQELPRHHLTLSPNFLVAPIAGLKVLQVRHSAKETVYGLMRNVVGQVINAGSGEKPGPGGEQLSPHEFATRLFDEHESFFLTRTDALGQLLRYVDPSIPVETPLCFRLAAAAAVAEGWEAEERSALTLQLFERGVGFAPDPAEAASESACVVGLFGAGGSGSDGRDREPSGGPSSPPPLSLDVLAGPLVPPAAAAMVLSRVLSSWAVADTEPRYADAAEVILAAVASNRQGLHALLEAVLPHITEESGTCMGTEWGTSFDYAVPELRAAFVSASSGAVLADSPAAGTEGHPQDQTLRLLFRILYQPSGGLPGVRFPLGLLAEVRDHNPACAMLVANRVLTELRALAEEDSGRVWAWAEQVWPLVAWDATDTALVEGALVMLRAWMLEVESNPNREQRARCERTAVGLLRQLPLQRIPDPEVALGPPIPAHILACLAHRELGRCNLRIAALEAENEALRQDLVRISMERHKSN